jgi:hypothetical protein
MTASSFVEGGEWGSLRLTCFDHGYGDVVDEGGSLVNEE